MIRYILRRLISVIPTLIGVTFVIFMFQRLIPGDPAVAMLGEHATEENVERIREQFGLNRPVFLDREALAQGDLEGFFDTQYFRYMGRLLRLDLGNSIHRRIPVAETLADTLSGHHGAGLTFHADCYHHRHAGGDRLCCPA